MTAPVDPCLDCEAAEAVDGFRCGDCAELAAEAAAERLHEGDPPASLAERARLAHRDRRSVRGY